MKKTAIWLAIAMLVVFLSTAAWAQSRGPAADQLVEDFYGKRTDAVPQVTYNYLVDLVSNAYGSGYGSVFVLTNYHPLVRNHIQGFVVPRGGYPGDELEVDIWLNPYEVQYINLSNLGLGNENGWAFLTSIIQDFGCGVLLFCTTGSNPGMTWIQPWYWVQP